MGDAAPKGFDRVIADYYERSPEEARLMQGPFQLEEARTRELIQRFAPPPPGTILDVGGAAGAYALWLAEVGYAVHLLDPVPSAGSRSAEAQRCGSAAPRLLSSGRCTRLGRAGSNRGRGPPARTALPPDRRWGSGPVAARGGPRSQAGRPAVRRGHLPVGFGVGRSRARPPAGPPVRADRGARSSGRPTPQSDGAAGLLHDGLFPSPRGPGGRGAGCRLRLGRGVRNRRSGLDPAGCG